MFFPGDAVRVAALSWMYTAAQLLRESYTKAQEVCDNTEVPQSDQAPAYLLAVSGRDPECRYEVCPNAPKVVAKTVRLQQEVHR